MVLLDRPTVKVITLNVFKISNFALANKEIKKETFETYIVSAYWSFSDHLYIYMPTPFWQDTLVESSPVASPGKNVSRKG